jgi:hypothetical protein
VSVGKTIPPNSIVLTFDDGYLDNWVYAYPLLKKYGFKGTIFVNPEFVDPTEDYRPNLEDVWAGKVRPEEMTSNGFLSWREMKEMGKDGIMDMQSHGMTHTWYFTGPEIIDFRHPGDPYVWMNWNRDMNRKHKYLTENQEDLIELGAPVYQHEKSLAARRYFPDTSLDKTLIQYVKEDGGKGFFKSESWRTQLFQIVEDYTLRNNLRDGYESEKDQLNRYRWELGEARAILEKELNKKVRFFCWPGGGYTDISLSISRNSYVCTTLSSKDFSTKRNVYREDPSRVKRIGVPAITGSKTDSIKYNNGFYLYLYLKGYQGSHAHKYARKAIKVFSVLKDQFLSL